jgi:predicted RNA-binding protein
MSRDTNSTTRRRVLLGIGTGTIAGLAGCGGTGGGGTDTATETETATPTETPTPTETETATETPAGTASVRVAHMSPNAPNVDVYVDGNAVLEDVAFGAVSQYLEVPAGEREVEITAAGDADASVFSGAVPVEADTDYTIAAAGEIGDDADQAFEPLVLADDNSDPGGDTARVRVVHASPDAPAVDVTAESSGDALFDGVAYGESGYVEVPAGEYTLQVRGDTESNDGDVVATTDVDVTGGQVYTIFAAGYLTPDDEPADTPFQFVLAQDTGGGMSTEMASVRVAHLSPNAPNVDVYVDGDAVLEDVAFSAVSGYLDVPAGTRTVEITAAGDADTSVFEGDVPVEAGTDYTIAAIGEIGDDADQAFEPLVLEDDNSDPGGDTARVRAVHASPDAPAVDITAEAGTTLFDGVEYGGSGYTEVPGGDYTVQVRGDTEGNDGDVVADTDVSLAGGQVYTVFAAGYLTPDDEPADVPFQFVLAQDTGGGM